MFLGKELNVIGNKVSSAKTKAVFLKSLKFSKISPAYFTCVVFLGAPITSIFLGCKKLFPNIFKSLFS